MHGRRVENYCFVYYTPPLSEHRGAVTQFDGQDGLISPLSNHKPLCVIICYMFIPKQWTNRCVLGSLFVLLMFVSYCLCDGVEIWCCKPKKTAQLPLEDNGT